MKSQGFVVSQSYPQPTSVPDTQQIINKYL